MSNDENEDNRLESNDMSSRPMGTITKHLRNMKQFVNVDDSFNAIVNWYFEKVSGRTNAKLRASTAPSDGQDVASEISMQLFKLFAAHNNWVSNVAVDREGLLVVMARLAKWRVEAILEKENRPIRGGGNVIRESDAPEGSFEATMDDAPANRTLVKEEIRAIEKTLRKRSANSRINGMGDQRVSIFHAWRAGRNTEEIGQMINRSNRTAQREINEIIKILIDEFSYPETKSMVN